MQSSDSSSRENKEESALDRSGLHVQKWPQQEASARAARLPPKPPQKWQAWEDVALIVAARRYGMCQWKHVAREVGNNRNHMQVLQRWKAVIEPAFLEVKWSQTDDALLKFVANNALESRKLLTAVEWKQLAARIPFRSGREVEARWYNCLAHSKQKLDYTAAESKKASWLKQDKAAGPSLLTIEPFDDVTHGVLSSVLVKRPQPEWHSSEHRQRPYHGDLDKKYKIHDSVAEHELRFSSFANTFDYTSYPVLTSELEVHDNMTAFPGLPYSTHQIDPLESSELRKQEQQGEMDCEHCTPS